MTNTDSFKALSAQASADMDTLHAQGIDPWAPVDVALRLNGTLHANHPSHDFTGIDGRCYNCDCRPFGRHAPHPCELA